MKVIYVTLLVAVVAIIMISDTTAEEKKVSEEKKQTGEEVKRIWEEIERGLEKKVDEWLKRNLRPSTIRRLETLGLWVLDEILITLSNIVFNVGWEETYDYLFGNYGMTNIPYFPLGVTI
ncbi:uncharacterized protein LOC114940518 [Nylanderia fulva]|uniref:uncharacterized protein LOC114940518 n=1 Tax=Nylanderia fulva TaxID=613905 RepID=UPI0010FAF055|nr:uncharacterized protein LOC114940518 [Nylanderia fulva]